MAKKIKKEVENKKPKTIKLSTVIIAVAFVVVAVVSFAGGFVFANHYNANVQHKAEALASKMRPLK